MMHLILKTIDKVVCLLWGERQLTKEKAKPRKPLKHSCPLPPPHPATALTFLSERRSHLSQAQKTCKHTVKTISAHFLSTFSVKHEETLQRSVGWVVLQERPCGGDHDPVDLSLPPGWNTMTWHLIGKHPRLLRQE